MKVSSNELVERNYLKISVVVPSFNQAKFIEKTLKSVINQNYPNLELIVIDGGSSDQSIEIIQSYEASISYWVSEPDGGQTNGLIKGFQLATGEVLCWLNSDDLHESSTLHQVNSFFQSNPGVDAVFGDALWIDQDGHPIREQREIGFNRFIWLYTYNYIPGMSMFWRRKIYEKVGGLSTEFQLAMDADLWIRFSEVALISHVPEIWSRMRFYPEQKNRRLRAASDLEDRKIRSRYVQSGNQLIYRLNCWIAYAMRITLKLIFLRYSRSYKRYMENYE